MSNNAVPKLTRRPRTGFVLLMTLLILAVAAAAMADVSRRSLRRALEANDAEQALQQKWAATSVRRTLLPRAALVINGAEQRTRRPAATVRTDLFLGDGPSLTPVSLLFGDEGAKLNLNTLYERDRRGLQRSLTSLFDTGPLRVELRPNPPGRDELAAPVPPFESFGQVFDAPSPAALAGASAEVTLWGDGKLDYRRASAAVLAEGLTGELGRGEVGRLVQLRDTPAGQTLAGLFDALALPQRDRDRLAARLTESASTFSLWTVAGPPGRQTVRLAVLENTSDRGIRNVDFAW